MLKLGSRRAWAPAAAASNSVNGCAIEFQRAGDVGILHRREGIHVPAGIDARRRGVPTRWPRERRTEDPGSKSTSPGLSGRRPARHAAHNTKSEKQGTDTFFARIISRISADPHGERRLSAPLFRGQLHHDALQFIFDPPVYISARKFGGHPDRVLDGVGVGPSVADDADALTPSSGAPPYSE